MKCRDHADTYVPDHENGPPTTWLSLVRFCAVEVLAVSFRGTAVAILSCGARNFYVDPVFIGPHPALDTAADPPSNRPDLGRASNFNTKDHYEIHYSNPGCDRACAFRFRPKSVSGSNGQYCQHKDRSLSRSLCQCCDGQSQRARRRNEKVVTGRECAGARCCSAS